MFSHTRKIKCNQPEHKPQAGFGFSEAAAKHRR